MAFDVCQKCFVLRFRALTLIPFYRFSSLLRYCYRKGVVWDCKWDNFIQKQHSYVQNAFLLNILRMNRCMSIKFCICIDIYIYIYIYIYMIYIYTITFCGGGGGSW